MMGRKEKTDQRFGFWFGRVEADVKYPFKQLLDVLERALPLRLQLVCPVAQLWKKGLPDLSSMNRAHPDDMVGNFELQRLACAKMATEAFCFILKGTG